MKTPGIQYLLSLNLLCHFYLQEGGATEIRFFDPSGRLLDVIEKTYPPGDQVELIQLDDLTIKQGLVYCQVVSNRVALVGKILIIK